MGKTIADQFREEGLRKGMTIAEQSREEGFKKGVDQGIAQGVAQGKITHTVEMLLRLLRKRFGDVPPTAEERIRTASIDRLDEWAERILTAATLDEVFA